MIPVKLENPNVFGKFYPYSASAISLFQLILFRPFNIPAFSLSQQVNYVEQNNAEGDPDQSCRISS